MKDKLMKLMRVLSLSDELYIDIELEMGHFHTIEISEDSLILHNFDADGYDNSFDFESLNEDDKIKIYDNLKVLIYN
tara:strand:- start:354 stop:584 length:231 start_codon:yes stop_codon:yes gene_type:complete